MIFLLCDWRSLPESACRRKFSKNSRRDSDWKYWTRSARRKCCTCFFRRSPGRGSPGSCGFPVPGYEAKIVDDEGAPVPQGEIGNLWVKGASAFSEYLEIPELTKQTKIGGWVMTGDKFFRDADGYYHYCGRSDDMMKVSGMWVAPTEVENALARTSRRRRSCCRRQSSNKDGLRARWRSSFSRREPLRRCARRRNAPICARQTGRLQVSGRNQISRRAPQNGHRKNPAVPPPDCLSGPGQ